MALTTLNSRQRELVYNNSITSAAGFNTDTYLTGSRIVFPQLPTEGCFYRLTFDVTKTAAGTATPILNVRVGTAGTTADTARLTFTFGSGTAAVDAGLFTVNVVFRSVGSGTSAVITGVTSLISNLTTTGISNAVKTRIATSAGFDSTIADLGIGVSYNAGASANHTIQLVRSEYYIK